VSLVHPPILESRLLRWPDEAACRASAARLAAHAALREACIELRGPLGAGKTTFVRHLLRALGVRGTVKSPTYAVMEPYALPTAGAAGAAGAEGAEGAADAGGGDAWHFDFYRFDDPQEWKDAGFRDVYAARGLKVAEWPDKAAGLLPRPDLRIDISVPEAGATLPAAAPDAGAGAGVNADTDAGAGADDDADVGADAGADDDAPAAPRLVRIDALTPLGVGLLPP